MTDRRQRHRNTKERKPMMPITRREVEILLDTPDQHDYVVSAYVDLTVRNGFDRYVSQQLRNQEREALTALGGAKAHKDIEADIEVVRREARAEAHSSARGLATFSAIA